jgi:hypothetical protein
MQFFQLIDLRNEIENCFDDGSGSGSDLFINEDELKNVIEKIYLLGYEDGLNFLKNKEFKLTEVIDEKSNKNHDKIKE